MANRTNEEKAHGEGFFATAIADYGNLTRAFILIGVLISILAYIFYHGTDFLLSKIGPKISFSAGAVNITVGGKSMSVVNVPAYKFWTQTGVKLEKNNIIKINASGLVSTSAYSPLPNDAKNNLSENEKRFIAIESDRDIHTGWRNADGQPIHVIKHANGIGPDKECNGDMVRRSNKLRLDAEPGAEYGTLLAFIILGESSEHPKKIDKLLGSREVKILRLGSRSEIKYDKDAFGKDAFIVNKFSASPQGKPEQQTIPASYENGELYLAINDTVVNKEEDMSYPCEVERSIDKNRKRQIELYKMMGKPEDIWYLDNRGSFLVTIEKGPAGETK